MAATIRPIWTELDLGAAGWRRLHDLAAQRGRSTASQSLALVRFALYRDLEGDDVELSQDCLETLLRPEPAAAV
jgi:hypothetical protein